MMLYVYLYDDQFELYPRDSQAEADSSFRTEHNLSDVDLDGFFVDCWDIDSKGLIRL